jgi:UDP-N-acetylmuramoyl-L-alanyl-D-glutamate--2,6-diaminopimelate ligase
MVEPRRLADLIPDADVSVVSGSAETPIAALTADSRTVTTGALFAGLPGVAADGAAFVPAAVTAGAAAVLVGAASVLPSDLPPSVTILRADEPRLALARIAARFYPRQPATIVAVTGTNGKTSIAEFTRQLFAALGERAASLGTLGVVTGESATYGALTTPDPITVHRTLDALAGQGVTHLALEASSHGLDQYRLDGVRLAAGAFNNLGRDHLDYHPTMAAYLEAKLGLFRRLLRPGQPAIVNLDGAEHAAAVAAASARGLTVHTVGTAGETIRLHSAVETAGGQDLVVLQGGRTFEAHLDLIGTYQASNALVAAALVLATTPSAPADVFAALRRLRGVPGRLDVVARHRGGTAVVDYAHKPEALSAALAALRPFVRGRLICVFGCGGNRDRGKRPIMGEIAAREADLTIVTDDNPRQEDPAAIRAEVLAGARSVIGRDVREVGDRAAAIRAGVALMGQGDVLLVAGKGHETGQIIGARTLPFSDHEEIRAAIAEQGP